MVGSSEVGPDSALLVLLLAVVAVGVLDGLSQGAIFGDAADLPPAYTHVSLGLESVQMKLLSTISHSSR